MSAALGNPSKLDCPRLHDISERDTLINAFTIPRVLPGAVCNIWAYSPPQSKAKYKKTYSLVGYALSAFQALNIFYKIIFYKRRNAEFTPFYLL